MHAGEVGSRPIDTSASDSGTLGLIPDESAREREELQMLFVGFATGLSIAGVFLLYVVMEVAHLLP